jgi:hypothetical protein
MTTTTLLRRSAAVLTSAGVVAALTILTPATAQAGVHAQYAAIGSAYASYDGPTAGGSCNLTSGDNSVQSSIADFGQGTKRRSVDLDATFTASDNPADTVRVRGHVDSKMTVEKRGRDLRSFELAAGGKVSINHSIAGSSCVGQGSVAGATQTMFTEHKKGWLYITRETHKPNSAVTVVVVNLKSGKLVTLEFFQGTKSHSTSRALLKPGKYGLVETQVGVSVGGFGLLSAKGAQRAAKVKLTSTISGEFKRIKKR